MLLGRICLFSLIFAAAVHAVPLPTKELDVASYGHPPEVAQAVDTVDFSALDISHGQADISDVSRGTAEIALSSLPVISLRQPRAAVAHVRRDDDEGSDDTEKRNLLAAVCALASLLAFILMSLGVFAWDLYKKSKDRAAYFPQPATRPPQVAPKTQDEAIALGVQRTQDLEEVQPVT
ncbi:hypothetical protein BV20DRAFT_1050774 [Pilatotrama ljubarskyi]|nr:hypothetical protein BV20DRAFT_1050774 [Pilatotrama ljubarskyi]